jgi:hypothetical protein
VQAEKLFLDLNINLNPPPQSLSLPPLSIKAHKTIASISFIGLMNGPLYTSCQCLPAARNK